MIGFSGADSSSAVKGETIADTIEVVNGYADIIAMRHPKEGAPVVASMHTAVPLINAGDGGHFHPTQTLADLLTIHHEKGTFDNLTIGLPGGEVEDVYYAPHFAPPIQLSSEGLLRNAIRRFTSSGFIYPS